MKLDWSHWFYSLVKTTIGGVSATGGAYLGTLIGHEFTTTIPVMNWQSLGFVLLASTMTNLFFFLQKSPVPEDTDTKVVGQ